MHVSLKLYIRLSYIVIDGVPFLHCFIMFVLHIPIEENTLTRTLLVYFKSEAMMPE